jgi:phosphatidylglycerol:prolipoprotein diacylglycerol transferase
MDWIYVLIMLAALVTGLALARGRQQRLGLTRGQRLGIIVGAFCGAMIGAKLPFVLADRPGLLSGRAWFVDGKTILLGLAGGYLGVEVAKWALEVRIKTGDSFAVPVAASVAIGRLGCLYAGCCYGTPTDLPWGMVFPNTDPPVPRHPAQLYEFLFHAAAAVALAVLQRRGRFSGQLIKLYLIAYCGYRFLSEFIRPEAELWLGLTGYQWSALLLAGLLAYLWRRDAVRFAAAGTAQMGDAVAAPASASIAPPGNADAGSA